MNATCSAGVDNIPMIFWKNSVSILCTPLSFLFQRFLDEGFVPDDWKKSRIMALYKGKGSPSKVENYRGINLLPTIAKVFEKVICDYLGTHCANLGILSDKQYGFRRKSSTTANLIATYDSISKFLDQDLSVDVVYFDFSKAFDKAPIDLLLGKLSSYGIDSFVLRWISNYYSGRSQTVVLNGTQSDSILVTSGVLQGSVLGHLLFKIYINDLLQLQFDNEIVAFVDDCKIFGVVSEKLSLQSNVD